MYSRYSMSLVSGNGDRPNSPQLFQSTAVSYLKGGGEHSPRAEARRGAFHRPAKLLELEPRLVASHRCSVFTLYSQEKRGRTMALKAETTRTRRARTEGSRRGGHIFYVQMNLFYMEASVRKTARSSIRSACAVKSTQGK